MDKEFSNRETKGIRRYAKIFGIFAWIALLYHFLQGSLEFFNVTSDYNFQSAVIRGNWYIVINALVYILSILLRGIVYWLILKGLSVGVIILISIYSGHRTVEKSIKELPVLYNAEKVLWISKWLERMAIIAVIATVIASLPYVIQTQRIILSYNLVFIDKALAWVIAIILNGATLIVQCAFTYLGLRGFAHVLKMIMEMELNSRR